MKHSLPIVAAIVLIICCIWLPAPAAATNLGGYTVEPVTPGMDTGIPLETTEVSFWELPIQVIILSLAFSLSPVAGDFIELLLFAKLYVYLGYRKVARATVFDNVTRNRIYACIQDNPGIFFSALVRTTGVKRGTLRYHLLILKLNGEISILDNAGNPRYFENSERYSKTEKNVLKHIRNDTDCRIFRLLLENPALTRNDLGEHFGLSLSTVSWRMNRLNDAGIVLAQKSGKNVRYRINPDVRHYLEKYLVPIRETMPVEPLEKFPEPG